MRGIAAMGRSHRESRKTRIYVEAGIGGPGYPVGIFEISTNGVAIGYNARP